MANWASVSYRIEGKQKDLQEIYELFGEFDKGERKPFDELSAKNWEGNIAWALGEDIKDYYLRGFIQCCEIEKGYSPSRQRRHGEHRISVIFLKSTMRA